MTARGHFQAAANAIHTANAVAMLERPRRKGVKQIHSLFSFPHHWPTFLGQSEEHERTVTDVLLGPANLASKAHKLIQYRCFRHLRQAHRGL
jgi:hypothetical protein